MQRTDEIDRVALDVFETKLCPETAKRGKELLKGAKILGEGAFGEVSMVTLPVITSSGETIKKKMAVKRYKGKIDKDEIQTMLELKKLGFRHMARLIDIVDLNSGKRITAVEDLESMQEIDVGLFMEYAEEGNLNDVMQKLRANGELNPALQLDLVEQVINIVAELEEEGYQHRDLKLENLLVFRDEEGNYVVKLADFGLAGEIGERQTTPGKRDCNLKFAPPALLVALNNYHSLSDGDERDEQIDIIDKEARSGAIDKYQLGLMVQQMLMGVNQYELASEQYPPGTSSSPEEKVFWRQDRDHWPGLSEEAPVYGNIEMANAIWDVMTGKINTRNFRDRFRAARVKYDNLPSP